MVVECMTIYVVSPVEFDDDNEFRMNCDEPWIAAEEYFEHRGSKRIREEDVEEFVVEVYEAADEDGERAEFKCTRSGVAI